MRIYEQPLDGYEQKFVVTEDGAYFVPYYRSTDAPRMIEILGEIFDLDNPDVVRDIDGRLFGGRIILGYYYPYTKEVIIHSPLETSDYVQKRMKEVFDV
jgi:hypothetical protein